MQMLYDSDAFVVVGIAATEERYGFEIVDKRVNKEVYLDGHWAGIFQAQIDRWQANTPTQEEVENILDSYCELAQNPLVVH
jgi:nucleoside-triphosphatase THEP1